MMELTPSKNKKLENIYYGIGSGAYASGTRLLSAARSNALKVTLSEVTQFLNAQEGWQLFREPNKKPKIAKHNLCASYN